MGNSSSHTELNGVPGNIDELQTEQHVVPEEDIVVSFTDAQLELVITEETKDEATDTKDECVESNHNDRKENVHIDTKKDVSESIHETIEQVRDENPMNDKQQQDNINKTTDNDNHKDQKISFTIKQTILTYSPVMSIRRKTSKMMNVTPQNLDIVEYCKSLINISFHGQITLKPKTEFCGLLEDSTTYLIPLFLQSLDTFLRSFGTTNKITGEEEEFKYYIQGLLEKRNARDCMEKFWKDAERFVQIYNKRGGLSDQLNHSNYWGTRQQLLAGKIIADYIDPDYGPLDPIFGVLFCPVAGRAGPGDSGIVHEILFDDDGPLAYHSAVHDAFGYLLTFHNVGPGYNYVGADCEVLNASRCMSGQISGWCFWKELLKKKSEKAFFVA